LSVDIFPERKKLKLDLCTWSLRLDPESAVSGQQSALSDQQSAISDQQSAVSSQQSAVSSQQSASTE
jgi:hypothetical protein